jgi:tRNA threonylcarbamoyladenosine biosynthesis protein TsaE
MPDGWQLVTGNEVSLQQLPAAARELLNAARGRKVWLFFGEMGSGKTTLIKAIGMEIGVAGGMSSPTFSIINEYDAGSGRKIYHFDLYRIKNEKELIDIGASEYFDSEELCLIEWPEKLSALLPTNHFSIRITTTGPQLRKIEYQ